jgi:hypothetical protein
VVSFEVIPIKMVAFNLKLHKKMNVKFERLESAPIDFLKKIEKRNFWVEVTVAWLLPHVSWQ